MRLTYQGEFISTTVRGDGNRKLGETAQSAAVDTSEVAGFFFAAWEEALLLGFPLVLGRMGWVGCLPGFLVR